MTHTNYGDTMKTILSKSGNALTRTGLVAAFLATAGVVAVEQSADADGVVRCWGGNEYGLCNPPADLGPCSSVAGGHVHTIALRSDGGVRCWGDNNSGQCNTPADLGACSRIAGGLFHTIALQSDGGVRCWGYNDYGQCNPPADLGPCSSVAGGYSTPSHSEGMVASGAGDPTVTASATPP